MATCGSNKTPPAETHVVYTAMYMADINRRGCGPNHVVAWYQAFVFTARFVVLGKRKEFVVVVGVSGVMLTSPRVERRLGQHVLLYSKT